ncbi:hypothetical protein YC2023_054935 [Brassica napus]
MEEEPTDILFSREWWWVGSESFCFFKFENLTRGNSHYSFLFHSAGACDRSNMFMMHAAQQDYLRRMGCFVSQIGGTFFWWSEAVNIVPKLEDYQPQCHFQMELQNRDIFSAGDFNYICGKFCFIGTLGVPRISHYKDIDVSRASRFFTNEKSSLHILEHCIRA